MARDFYARIFIYPDLVGEITERDPDTPRDGTPEELTACAGALVVFSDNSPCFLPLPLYEGRLDFGREQLLENGIHDPKISRHHLRIELSQDTWILQDLESTNGSWVNGRRLARSIRINSDPVVVRCGKTVLLLQRDLSEALRSDLEVQDGAVSGPRLNTLYNRIRKLAKAGQGLLIVGDSGVGKEVAARVYHQATGRGKGPFIAVNCAAIPKEMAERLLFGTQRGAYSGAVTDADGYLQAADKGTLFLDEIAELEPTTQGKLLRVLESREVISLGATRPRLVDLALCAATLRDLRSEVRSGRFREDLYYRLGRPSISIPTLRERLEEIPWLIDLTLQTLDAEPQMAASPALIESCMLRPWPGNIRELRTEIRNAAINALSLGQSILELRHLEDQAGQPLDLDVAPSPSETSVEREESKMPTPQELRRALQMTRGNMSRAAFKLGVPRSTLRRMVSRAGIDPAALRHDEKEGAD